MRKVCFILGILSALTPIAIAQDFVLYNNPFLWTGLSPDSDVATNATLWFRGGPDSVIEFSPPDEYNVHRTGSGSSSKGLVIDAAGGIWAASYDKIDHIHEGQVDTYEFEEALGSIAAAPDGSVWASLWAGDTGRWVVRFENASWEAVPGATEACAQRICFEADGTGWFARGSMTQGWLARYKEGAWAVFEEGLPPNEILGMAVREAGEVWMADLSFVRHFQDGQLVRMYGQVDGLAGFMPTCLEIDDQGRVWVGDYINGVSVFDGQQWTVYNMLNSGLPNDSINGIAASPEGTVFICTDQGLAWYRDGAWDNYFGDTLLSNDIRSVAVNDARVVFYGSEFGDVGYCEAPSWGILHDSQSAEANPVYDIAFDHDGGVWLGQPDMVRVYTDSFTDYPTAGPDGMPLVEARRLRCDGTGSVWACAQAGLARYNGESWLSWETGAGMTPQCVTCDRNGKVWVAIPQGVAVFEGDALTEWFPQYQNVKAITCDRDGILWFLLNDRDILEYDPGSALEIAWHNPLDWYGREATTYIACDSDNTIWLGTDVCIRRFDRLSWVRFDTSSGAVTGGIRDIWADEWGNVWFATKFGLLHSESGMGPGPSITIATDKGLYQAGDSMTVSLSYENPGPDVDIDIQIACQLPDGTLFYYPGVDTPVPFISGMLPSGTVIPMVLVLSYEFGEDFPTGDYVWMTAMFEQGTFNMITDIATAPWRFE